MVLKQCGQLATIFLAPTSFKVAMLALAISWKRYSLPMRPRRVAGAGLARPKDPESDTGAVQHARR
jgi:hypothetical protein